MSLKRAIVRRMARRRLFRRLALLRSVRLFAKFARTGFDAKWYVSQYPDVVAKGDNPLRHYLEHGRSERRMPTRQAWVTAELAARAFDADWYRSQYPDVAESGLDPADHFALFGLAEGRFPTIHHARSAAWVRTHGPG